MEKILKKYIQTGAFNLKITENLKQICTAPNKAMGIYLIYNVSDCSDELLYIGCCGHITNNGSASVRKTGGGGIFGRIVNGHQFGKVKRWQSIPLKMDEENFSELKFVWFETFNDEVKHSPIYVESLLLQRYFEIEGRLPKWNLKF